MTTGTISAWIIPLAGHEFDLEDLPLFLDGSSVTIVKQENTYYLRLPVSIVGTELEQVRAVAGDYLARINGIASVLNPEYRPIEVADEPFHGLDNNGRTTTQARTLRQVEERSKILSLTAVTNGIAQADRRRGSMGVLLKRAERNQNKLAALALIGLESPTWSQLYVVLELVQKDVRHRMFSENWISETDAKTFRCTANSYKALGTAARHGPETDKNQDQSMTHQTAARHRRKGIKKPPQYMTYQTAIQRIRSLARSWIADSSTDTPVE